MNIEKFDYSVNLLQSIIWQYSNAPNLTNLIESKQAWYDLNQTEFWRDWYTNVFNLQTANTFGLSVWSYILQVPSYVLNKPEPDDKPLWGFNNNSAYPTLENTYFNFGGVPGNIGGNFSTRGQIITLTDEEQRFLLRLRFFQLFTTGNVEVSGVETPTNQPISGINNFLQYLISTSDIGYDGTIYVLDGLDMSMTYVFTTENFPPFLLEAIQTFDIFPRPAGVKLKYYTSYSRQFGFNKIAGSWPNLENTNLNFGHGNLIAS